MASMVRSAGSEAAKNQVSHRVHYRELSMVRKTTEDAGQHRRYRASSPKRGVRVPRAPVGDRRCLPPRYHSHRTLKGHSSRMSRQWSMRDSACSRLAWSHIRYCDRLMGYPRSGGALIYRVLVVRHPDPSAVMVRLMDGWMDDIGPVGAVHNLRRMAQGEI
jgi:hypothetical protein